MLRQSSFSQATRMLVGSLPSNNPRSMERLLSKVTLPVLIQMHCMVSIFSTSQSHHHEVILVLISGSPFYVVSSVISAKDVYPLDPISIHLKPTTERPLPKKGTSVT